MYYLCSENRNKPCVSFFTVFDPQVILPCRQLVVLSEFRAQLRYSRIHPTKQHDTNIRCCYVQTPQKRYPPKRLIKLVTVLKTSL